MFVKVLSFLAAACLTIAAASIDDGNGPVDQCEAATLYGGLNDDRSNIVEHPGPGGLPFDCAGIWSTRCGTKDDCVPRNFAQCQNVEEMCEEFEAAPGVWEPSLYDYVPDDPPNQECQFVAFEFRTCKICKTNMCKETWSCHWDSTVHHCVPDKLIGEVDGGWCEN